MGLLQRKDVLQTPHSLMQKDILKWVFGTSVQRLPKHVYYCVCQNSPWLLNAALSDSDHGWKPCHGSAKQFQGIWSFIGGWICIGSVFMVCNYESCFPCSAPSRSRFLWFALMTGKAPNPVVDLGCSMSAHGVTLICMYVSWWIWGRIWLWRRMLYTCSMGSCSCVGSGYTKAQGWNWKLTDWQIRAQTYEKALMCTKTVATPSLTSCSLFIFSALHGNLK